MTTCSEHATGVDVAVRWMLRRDEAAVLAIERASFEFPWAAADFREQLSQRTRIGMVAVPQNDPIAGRPVGYVVTAVGRGGVEVLTLAVSRSCRRRGVGRRLVERIIGACGRVTPLGLLPVRAKVRERNLGAQLFLRALGFRAVAVARQEYEETAEDAYWFEYLR